MPLAGCTREGERDRPCVLGADSQSPDNPIEGSKRKLLLRTLSILIYRTSNFKKRTSYTPSLWVQSTVHLISPSPPISYKLVLFEPPTWKEPRMYWSSQVQMYQALEKEKSQEESFISVNSTLIVAEIVLITDKTSIFDQFTCVMFCYEPDMPKVHD